MVFVSKKPEIKRPTAWRPSKDPKKLISVTTVENLKNRYYFIL